MVVIDPVARRMDGESVRIAKDVLCAGARTKISLPETGEEFARALARRGRRRPVVIGDDRTLLRTVGLLHRERELAEGGPLGMIPVGDRVALARSLGVPTGTVAAARAVLEGASRRLDLLVDDSDGVVIGGLRVPALGPSGPGAAAGGPPSVWTACRTLVRTLVRPAPPQRVVTYRLRVEADGVLLSDLDAAVEGVSVRSRGGGTVEVEVAGADCASARAAQTVTVSGPDFRYRADGVVGGPVRTRTWTVKEGAWGLVVPPEAAG
ncbi:acylglycerol kinase family protein [Streptomyces sp. NBC_00237]|uniref:diacylglycerol kinase family protein n=1 Tax=Streptomyces sp. NBC_00237 TaxID=2975687 RepID=UPI0022539925|nr:diacylglycerol kinase family protein [Streptomyces sp. NBC_00237]MCX5207266.1 acylglycerol kinase family protein [Streptomyces sp. NBC_00237]